MNWNVKCRRKDTNNLKNGNTAKKISFSVTEFNLANLKIKSNRIVMKVRNKPSC